MADRSGVCCITLCVVGAEFMHYIVVNELIKFITCSLVNSLFCTLNNFEELFI